MNINNDGLLVLEGNMWLVTGVRQKVYGYNIDNTPIDNLLFITSLY